VISHEGSKDPELLHRACLSNSGTFFKISKLDMDKSPMAKLTALSIGIRNVRLKF